MGRDAEELEQSNHDQVSVLSDKNGVLNTIKDDLSTLLQGMQSRENELKDLTTKINQIEKKNVEDYPVSNCCFFIFPVVKEDALLVLD